MMMIFESKVNIIIANSISSINSNYRNSSNRTQKQSSLKKQHSSTSRHLRNTPTRNHFASKSAERIIIRNHNHNDNQIRLGRNLMILSTTGNKTNTSNSTNNNFKSVPSMNNNNKISKNKNCSTSLSNNNKMIIMDGRNLFSSTYSLVTLGLILLLGSITQTSAFQYDIWFKYPHPYTQTDPVTYCPESGAQQATPATQSPQQRQCQSTLPIYVNTLDSPKTLIPYTITQLLDFCSLTDAREYDHSQHTEWDDNIKLAPFDIKFGRNEECKMLCKKTYKMMSHADLYRIEELKLGLTRDYYHHWFADTFPLSWCYRQSPVSIVGPSPAAGLNTNTRGKECFIGFPMGYSTDERGLPEDERVPIGNFTKPNSLFLFNHFEFTFFYESGEGKIWSKGAGGTQAGRITAVRVLPRSINHEPVGLAPIAAQLVAGAGTTNGQQVAPINSNKCSYSMPPLEVPQQHVYGRNETLQFSYSYSVRFVEDEPSATWSQRWQRLESTLPGTAKGKWIVLFAILMLFSTGIPAAYAIARTIFSDRVLLYVNPRDEADEAAWKVLAGDIFREPLYIGLFSVLVGSGCQFIASVLLSEVFSTFISFFSTTIIVIVVVLFVVVHGFVGGYAAVRLYRTFGGEQWRTICIFVTLLNPLVIFCMLVMSRNLLLLYNGSIMALNVGLFGSIFMSAICFAFSLPSALAGGNIAFKMSSIEFPVRPTANQRELAEQLIWKQPLWTTLAVAFIPLFCFWSVESYPFYDSGGYIITVITILIVICLSISHCYYHLTQYDYRWWWRSYLACGLAAAYYFLHCVYYIFTNLFVDSFSNALLYISFAFFICLALFLLTGTIGFMVTFAFLWQTYSRTNASPDMNYAMFQKSGQLE